MTRLASYERLRQGLMAVAFAVLTAAVPTVARAEGDPALRPVATDVTTVPNSPTVTVPSPASSPVSVPVQPALVPGHVTHVLDPATAQEKPAHDFSPWSMFLSADTVVKSIMGLLLAASVLTWTIFFGKLIQLARERRTLDRAMRQLRAVKSLSGLGAPASLRSPVVAHLAAAAMLELRLSDAPGTQAGIKERVASRLREVEIANARHIRGATGILATIGSVGPFIGLLGTVWGIMNSFIGIAASGTTNLAVVAPGIAEALMATAMGLFAAIPAVVVYNHFARATARYLEAVGNASGEVARLVSRDLDRNASGQARAMAAE